MSDKPSLSEEFVCGPARLRMDVFDAAPGDQALVDMNFLNYRLAAVQVTRGWSGGGRARSRWPTRTGR